MSAGWLLDEATGRPLADSVLAPVWEECLRLRPRTSRRRGTPSADRGADARGAATTSLNRDAEQPTNCFEHTPGNQHDRESEQQDRDPEEQGDPERTG